MPLMIKTPHDPSNPTPPTPLPSADGQGIRAALRKCRELDDPVAVWAKSIPWLFLAVLVAQAGPMFVSWRSSELAIPQNLLFFVVIYLGISGLLSWFMFRPFRLIALKPKVMFVRAFAHDRSPTADRVLRNALRAALPGRYALAGIRPPYARDSMFVRALGEGFSALRYVGSSHFELEAADRNWFARLLASGATSHAVIVDLRALTPFVHDEIELAARLAMSPGRLFLVTDHSLTEDEWLARFIAAAKIETVDRSMVQWLKIPANFDQNQQEFTRDAASRLACIPNEPMGTPGPAYQKVRSRVADADWATPWRETSVARFLVVGLLMMALYYLVFRALPEAHYYALPGIAVLAGLFYLRAITRVSTHAYQQFRLGNSPRPGIPALVLSIISFPILVLIMIGCIIATNRATNIAMDRIKSFQGSNYADSLTFAIDSFRVEYGSLPFPAGRFSSDSRDGALLLAALRGEASVVGNKELNPRHYVFFSCPNSMLCERPEYRDLSGGRVFLDPFGNPYTIILDTEETGELNFDYGGTPIRLPDSRCAVFSPGKDRVLGNADDIKSWRFASWDG